VPSAVDVTRPSAAVALKIQQYAARTQSLAWPETHFSLVHGSPLRGCGTSPPSHVGTLKQRAAPRRGSLVLAVPLKEDAREKPIKPSKMPKVPSVVVFHATYREEKVAVPLPPSVCAGWPAILYLPPPPPLKGQGVCCPPPWESTRASRYSLFRATMVLRCSRGRSLRVSRRKASGLCNTRAWVVFSPEQLHPWWGVWVAGGTLHRFFFFLFCFLLLSSFFFFAFVLVLSSFCSPPLSVSPLLRFLILSLSHSFLSASSFPPPPSFFIPPPPLSLPHTPLTFFLSFRSFFHGGGLGADLVACGKVSN